MRETQDTFLAKRRYLNSQGEQTTVLPVPSDAVISRILYLADKWETEMYGGALYDYIKEHFND